jgi:nitrite reductase/ring-hydroxylating ferredoxin subunit
MSETHSQSESANVSDANWRVVLQIVEDTETAPSNEPSQIKSVTRDRVDSNTDFAVEVLVDDRVIAVFRHVGFWYAIDGMCSHQGGPLAAGQVRDGCVTCPWHGWQYDLATGIQLVNRQPLQESFQIREIENRVEVYVGQRDVE